MKKLRLSLKNTHYSKLDIQNSYQNGTHQFNNIVDENSPLIQNDTLNLHKTLKSILPHANISFGTNNNININNNSNLNANFLANNFLTNKNMQPFSNGLGENRMPLQQQDQRNFWPDDPAIVSLTDRSHSLLNGNFNGLNNGGLGKSFNELQYQLANNNNNNSNRSLSPSFLNTLSSINNNANKNQSSINALKLNQQRLNGEQQQQQQQFLNNQYFQNFNNKLDDNLNNLAQPFLNRLQSFNNLNGLNTNNNENINTNNNNNNNGYPTNLFSTSLLTDQLSQLVVNQDNGMNTLNMASLSLHQQFLMQQLTANFAAKKMQSE